MGLGEEADLLDDGDSGVYKAAAVSCSICLEAVTDNGDRSWAKLQCGHQFHLGESQFCKIESGKSHDLADCTCPMFCNWSISASSGEELKANGLLLGCLPDQYIWQIFLPQLELDHAVD